MNFVRHILRRLHSFFRKESLDAEMSAEIRHHLALQEKENLARGMSPEEARYAAQRMFGGVEQVKERCRDDRLRGFRWLEHVWLDLRFAARSLRKNPGFTATVVLTLALGIGANATIFSVINAVLLEPPPFADPARLVALKETRPLAGGTTGQRVNVPPSAGSFFDWRKQAPSLEKIAAVGWSEAIYLGGTEPELVGTAAVSSNFFSLLGVTPMLGRDFQVEEERPNAVNVVLLSHAFWQRIFAADPAVIGQALTLDSRRFTIIGVMPPALDGAGSARLTRNAPTQLWTPLTLVEAAASRAGPAFDVYARLRTGATLATAQAEIDAIMQRLATEFPATNTNRGGLVWSLNEATVGAAQSMLWLLLGAVGLVLLIACSSVANLLFARATLRAAETAVRAALGASRGRLLQQFFTESLLLSVLGCAAGLTLAWVSLQAFISVLPPTVPQTDAVTIDGRVLAYTVLVSLLTGVTFGLAPAWQGAKTDLNTTLKTGSRTYAGGPGAARTRDGLVVLQVAVSLILLVGAGLLLRTFMALRGIDPGFDPRNVITWRVNLPRGSNYSDEQKRAAIYERMLAELKTIPGVESAAAVYPVPFSPPIYNQPFRVPGRPVNPAELLSAQYSIVSPEYFRALRIRITQGRAFSDRDRSGSPAVALVNETLAQRMWPGENPLGRRIALGREEPEVVGVFADIKQRELMSEPRMQICVPALQQAQRETFVAVRGSAALETLWPVIRQRIAAFDASLPVSDVTMLEDRVAGSIRQQRFAMLLLALFAGTALVLGVIGLGGVMSYHVAQRTREFGIRMALGARVGAMLRLVVSQGLKLVLLGLAIGVLASLALTRTLSSMLFGVRPTDPATFAAVSLLLAVVGALACLLPARRAAKIDPMVALRAE